MPVEERNPEIFDADEVNGGMGKTVVKMVSFGVGLLLIATAISWFYRNSQYSKEVYQGRIEILSNIQSGAGDATPQELLSMGAQWQTTTEEGREAYTVGSKRRRTFEVAVATAGVGLSAGIGDAIGRPASTDVVESVQLAKLLRDIAEDQSVRAIAQVRLSDAESVLAAVARRGNQALLQLARSNSAQELDNAAVLAAELSGIVVPAERAYFSNMSDSLTQTAARLRQIEGGENGNSLGAEDIRNRRSIVGNIKEYLATQGVGVTSVSTEGESANILVVKGIGTSDKLVSLLLDSAPAKSRLQEAGFVQVKAFGSDGSKKWDIGSGGRQ